MLWWNGHAAHFLLSRYGSILRSVGPAALSLPRNLDDKTTREAGPSRSTYQRQSKTNEHNSRVSEEVATWRS